MSEILLLSTSTVHGGRYLEYAEPYLTDLLDPGTRILFIPYARPSGIGQGDYAELFTRAVVGMGLAADSIHASHDPVAAVRGAEALFVGGGNTFVLLRELYAIGIIEAIRAAVAAGTPYIGSSAGSNVAGLTIGTTNDMPIVYPPTFDSLRLVPFNINPHYLDPDPVSTHMGETRATRINEFHVFNRQPVVALREGALLDIATAGQPRIELRGTGGGLLFRSDTEPEELQPGARLDDLLAPDSAAAG